MNTAYWYTKFTEACLDAEISEHWLISEDVPALVYPH